MPILSSLTASQVIKLLLIGDSGTGKTGAIASLVAAGYRVRMLDFDNGWESLAAAVQRTCPDKIDNVEVESLRDKYKTTPAGPVVDGMPKAFSRAANLLDKWTDGSKPGEWGPGYILVWDSLTFSGDAAYDWADALNPGAKDKRQIFYEAQKTVGAMLALLTGPAFNTNVIVTSHIRYMDLPDGTKKGFPTAVGSALGPEIPRFFNSFAACVRELGGKRTIKTDGTATLDLKNPKSFDMDKTLPIETGLATFFETLRGPCPSQTIASSSTTVSAESKSSETSPAPMPTSMGLSFPKGKPLAKALRGS
jgi:hypothetical protein